ncbi:fused MFS/spermidine synthase [Schlegelella sp. S2-27]|uniref:Fused MFS/spermidine synthase n=1 Tax=Caldimonas mangrovi TaxID=2944811 RepID=A0ABT0YS11_9BURK|nr:fused MFS/spermidine synthase [Caldimonas mangrovi]MCM5681519.1 fused MFS/spermidine synthase [Caldimonas mangrovi]
MPCGAADAAGRLVHVAQGDHHTVYVRDEGGSRYLSFSAVEKRVQTRVSLAPGGALLDDWVACLTAVVAAHPRPRRVLMLGVGGGALPMALRRILPDVQIDAVDHDAAVLRVATEFFGLEQDHRLRLHALDARVFIEQSRRDGRHYDVIVLDVFDDDYIPQHLMTVEFLREMRSALAAGGWLVANTFGPEPLWRREFASYASAYGDFHAIVVGWNRILVAGGAAAGSAGEFERDMLQRATALAPVGAGWRVGCIESVRAGACAAAPICDAEIDTPALQRLRKQAVARPAPPCWGAMAMTLVEARMRESASTAPA